MQRIVSLLVFQDTAPVPLARVSPWLDRRFSAGAIKGLSQLDEIKHRRFFKAHLPIDGLPLFEDVRYLHVARDGRDVALSYHNHLSGMSERALAEFDKNGLDDPTIRRPYPRAPADPKAFFHRWLTQETVPGEGSGLPILSYFKFERSFWNERRLGNILLIHYQDLLTDLDGEMKRIADFLDIEVPEPLWPKLIDAARFATMQAEGDKLMPHLSGHMEDGARRFFAQGRSGRWQGVLDDADLRLYEQMLRETVSPACAAWLTNGRLQSSDPRMAPD